MSHATREALKQLVRTYLVVAGPALLIVAQGSDPFDVAAWKVAAISGIPAAAMFAWRRWLDPSPIPSLAATPPTDDGGGP